MSGLRGPTVKNVVITAGGKRQGDRHVLAFPAVGYGITVLGVSGPVEGVRALATGAKLLATICGYEFADRWRDEGVTVNAVHPGIVSTGIVDDVLPAVVAP
jgi:hypothetical protein